MYCTLLSPWKRLSGSFIYLRNLISWLTATGAQGGHLLIGFAWLDMCKCQNPGLALPHFNSPALFQQASHTTLSYHLRRPLPFHCQSPSAHLPGSGPLSLWSGFWTTYSPRPSEPSNTSLLLTGYSCFFLSLSSELFAPAPWLTLNRLHSTDLHAD